MCQCGGHRYAHRRPSGGRVSALVQTGGETGAQMCQSLEGDDRESPRGREGGAECMVRPLRRSGKLVVKLS